MEIVKFPNRHNFPWRWNRSEQAIFWKYLYYFESGGLSAFPFFIIVWENPFIWMGILFILYIWWSHCKSLATFTFGADIPSLGDFSGHIVNLGEIRKIYFENFWVSLRSIFFHLVWIELMWEWQTRNPLERTTSTEPLRNNVYAFPKHTKWDFPPECCKSSRKDSLSLFLEFYPCCLENNALK